MSSLKPVFWWNMILLSCTGTMYFLGESCEEGKLFIATAILHSGIPVSFHSFPIRVMKGGGLEHIPRKKTYWFLFRSLLRNIWVRHSVSIWNMFWLLNFEIKCVVRLLIIENHRYIKEEFRWHHNILAINLILVWF